jgi:beta-fructofuranosidase
MLDGSGRRILFVNLNEGRSQRACEAAGWKGVMSLPVVISLAADGRSIRYEPAPELQALRQDLVEIDEIGIAPDTEQSLPEVCGDCIELDLTIEPQGASACGVKVRCAPDGSEETVIVLEVEQQTVQIDYRKASLRKDLAYPLDLPNGETQRRPRVQKAPFEFKQGQCVNLCILLDHSVLELFVDDRRYMAQRIYPSLSDSLEVRLFSQRGPATVRRLRAWTIGRARR